MKVKIFRHRKVDGKENYLCGCTLKEYIDSVSEDYMQYEIQRGIVPNVYLDKLIETMKKNGTIPMITLVDDNIEEIDENNINISNKFRILDGLQRTYRIKSIWKSIQWIKENDVEQLSKLSKLQLIRNYKKEINELGVETNTVENILKECSTVYDIERIIRYFEENEQWFEVWKGLSDTEIIEKMLILNAGHRSMTNRHQLELLFLSVYESLNRILNDKGNYKIIREKEMSDTIYSKNRNTGQFYFSHVISGIISFKSGMARTTNTELIRNLQDSKNLEDYQALNITYHELEEIMNFFMKLDDNLFRTYGDIGVKWIAKETVVVGIFAGLGKYAAKYYGIGNIECLKLFIEKIDTKCKMLNLNIYEDSKNKNLNISKVNIGNKIKKSVAQAIYDFVEKEEIINWEMYFRGEKNE